jgi:VanZ family protein
MRRLFQIASWLCLGAIGALSLVAPTWRPVTILPHNAEHVAIFVLAGLAVGLGYPNRAARHMAALTLFAAVVELAQFFAPGRHPRVGDFVVDALGACAGVALALVLTRITAAKTASPR